jgi:hypothetical protein
VKTVFSPKTKVAARQLFFGGCNASEKMTHNYLAHYLSILHHHYFVIMYTFFPLLADTFTQYPRYNFETETVFESRIERFI